ncbi:MAG TPA: hypothetical protein VKO18_09040 [Terriglobia bacterium]|nr:hypothetical protein [Terriglobia bacterium]
MPEVLVMLSSFFDDSGALKREPKVAVVGGYVALSDRAIALQEDWRRRFNLDGVKSFHMADFESCLGEYVGWQKDDAAKAKRRFHIESLAYFLNLRSLHYVGAGILIDVFDSVIGERLNAEEQRNLGGPHAFCFQCCIIELSNWIRENMPREIVDVFYEDGTKLGSEILRLYVETTTVQTLREKYKISQIAPLAKDSSIGILPADLVAYELFKYHFNRLDEPDRALRKLCEKILAGKESHGKFFSDPRGIHQYLDILERAGALKGDYSHKSVGEVL